MLVSEEVASLQGKLMYSGVVGNIFMFKLIIIILFYKETAL